MKIPVRSVAGFFAVLIMMVSVLSALVVPAAQALCPNSCEWSQGGRDYNKTYYLDTQVVGPGVAPWAPAEAPTAVTNATQFIAWMDQWINDGINGSVNKHTGAASSMINLMLGREGTNFTSFTDGVNQARNSYATWRALVVAYENSGDVQWTVPRINCEPYNQTNQYAANNDVFSYTVNGGNPCTRDDTIVFQNPETNATFAIRKSGGNIMADANSLVLSTTPPPAPGPPPAPPVVPVQTIFKTTGGDVAAGASFATSAASPCAAAPHTPGSGIASWNRRAASYAGAGGEYAAIAYGQVLDYITGQGTGVPPPANGLTFSNVDTGASVDLAAGVFGGIFTTAPCVDLWTTRPTNAQLTQYPGGILDNVDGNYRATSVNDLVIPASTIKTGHHVTIYVTGNVSIAGNIQYEAGTWANRRDIPSFKLVVLGSIYIDKSVTRLDGLYAAIPDTGYNTRNNTFAGPVKGTITTCASGFNSYNPATYLTSSYRTDCQNPLTFNGAVIANQFWMLRLGGSLATDVPAEVVNYTPETWMSINPFTSTRANTDYDSIIGLPPIL